MIAELKSEKYKGEKLLLILIILTKCLLYFLILISLQHGLSFPFYISDSYRSDMAEFIFLNIKGIQRQVAKT